MVFGSKKPIRPSKQPTIMVEDNLIHMNSVKRFSSSHSISSQQSWSQSSNQQQEILRM